MDNPPVPVFPNPEQHVSKKELAKEIRQVLVALANKMIIPENRNKIISFVSCIHPDSCKDPARIPYNRDKAKQNNKIECLCAKIYQLLKTYWQFYEDGVGIEIIKSKIVEIKQITQRGLNSFKTEGSDKEGYQLI